MRFAVIGLPRSGTTWAANWLTTNGVVCYHEPLRRFERLPRAFTCTGAWLRPDWLPERLVKIVRDPAAIRRSLRSLGLPELTDDWVSRFRDAPGEAFAFEDLFNPESAREIWRVLRDDAFDEARHEELVAMNIQPEFSRNIPDVSKLRQFIGGLYGDR